MGLTSTFDRNTRLGAKPSLALLDRTMPRRHTDPSAARVRVVVALVAATGLLGAAAASRLGEPANTEMPWWLIAIGYFGATGLAVHVRLHRDAHTVTLTEVPLTLGLCLAAPTHLMIGAAAGSAVALLLIRHQPPIKLLFNLGLHMATIAASLGLLHVMGAAGDPLAPRGWVAVVATNLLISGLGGSVAVGGVLRAGGSAGRTGALLPVTLTACLLNTLVGLAGARLVAHDGIVAALVAVPCIVCLLTYRLYTREQSERTRLTLLYESARAFGGARDVDAVVRTLLQRARELLRADRAELLLLPADSEGDVLRVRLDGAGSALVHAVNASATGEGLVAARGRVLPRGTREPQAAAALARLNAADAVVVPLRGEAGALGCLAVLDRGGDLGTFGTDDLALLETFAGQAATSLSHARVSAELHDLAYHDALTGLANRALLLKRLETAERRRTENADETGAMAVAYLDLDDFKTVNDGLGHAAGDRFLIEVAARLRRSLRAADMAARLGGDEFAVLLESVEGPADAAAIVGRLLDVLERPVCVDGVWLSGGASAGVVLVPRDCEVNPGTLLSQADVAMYRAKARGKGGVEVFEPTMQTRVVERHHLKIDLDTAVREGGLSVAYQPVVSLATHQVVGVEALVRWDHPVRGHVSPDEFIPLAEETGLIHKLGAGVLEAACSQAASWQRRRPGMTMAVNVSGRQLRDPAFPSAVADVLRRTGLDPALLTLEVTETVMVTDDSELRDALHLLRGLGCRLAIDDFGTGYSSLASLRELPVDTLKIAKPFVDGLGHGPEQDAFAEAIVGLGRTLGLTTIAEGIESAEQARRLEALTCDLGQGFLFSHPLPPEEVDALLDAAVLVG